jgi:hypothetical protein
MDPDGIVGGARLKQKNTVIRVLGESRRKHTAGRACADHHVIEFMHWSV